MDLEGSAICWLTLGKFVTGVKEETTLPLGLDLSLGPCSTITTSVYLVKLLYASELWFPKSENPLKSYFGQAGD